MIVYLATLTSCYRDYFSSESGSFSLDAVLGLTKGKC